MDFNRYKPIKHCRYCEKKMSSGVDEQYHFDYWCDCEKFLEEQELKCLLENNEREKMHLQSKLRSLKSSSALSKQMLELSQKYIISSDDKLLN